MSTNYIPNSSVCEYAGKSLHVLLQATSDDINQRLVPHEFVKVDGAYQEFMGSGADGYRVTLVFTGDNFVADLNAALAHFKKNPKGLLVHPVYGRKRAGWRSFTPHIDVQREINGATAEVVFAEDNLDPAAGQPQTVATQAQAVTDKTTQLKSATSGFSTSTIAKVLSFANKAQTYAAAALAVAQGNPPDPSMASLLGSTALAAGTTLSALESDYKALSTLATTRTLTLGTYSSCLDLDAATAKQRPTVETVTLPGAVSLSRLCADRYGPDAATQRDYVMSMNRIPSPSLIPAGTVLLMPIATV